MALFKPETLRSVTFSIFLIYRFISMGIIEFPLGHPRRILGIIYYTIISLSYGVTFFVMYDQLSLMDRYLGSSMARFAYHVYWFLILGLICVNFIINTLRDKEHYACIIELKSIETAVNSLGDGKSYKSLIVQETLTFFCVMFTVSFLLIYDMMLMKEYGYDNLQVFLIPYLLHLPMLLTVFGSFTIGIFNKIITHSFENLNMLLESMRVKNAENLTEMGNLIRVEVILEDKKRLERLRCIRKIHTRLVTLTKRWIKLNGVYIILFVGLITWKLIIDSYVTYVNLFESDLKEQHFIMWVSRTIVNSLEIIKLCMIVFPTAALTAEVRRTCGILLQHLQPIAFLRSEVHEFSLEFIRSPLRLSAGGFLDLDHSLIHMIISTAVTYLVVLIQRYRINDNNSSIPPDSA